MGGILRWRLGAVALATILGTSGVGLATMNGAASASGAGNCGAKHNQLCPAQVVPQVSNPAQIVAAIQSEPLTPGSISQVVAKLKKSVPVGWAGPTTSTKLPAKPLKLALISCSASLHGCVTPLLGAEAAAKKLGWKYTLYDGGGSPSSWNKVMLTAVASRVNAILFTSINPLVIQQSLRAAKAAGIPVISASSGSSQPNPTVAVPKGDIFPLLDVSQSFVDTGRQIADWIINDSKGKANVLVLTDKEYTSGVSMPGSVDEFNRRCPNCVLSTFDFLGANVGTTLASQTVDYLRAHPAIKYVDVAYDPAAAVVVPALAQAGMSKIKVCSLLGDQQNLNFIRTGEVQTCDAAYDNYYTGWAMVDQLLRHLNKQPFSTPLGENTPSVLLDKTNLPPSGSDWQTKVNYEAKYLALWKK
jgi:ribose transport system substrate-binding protein